MNYDTKKCLARQFISQCQTLRIGFDWIERATLATAITSFFISICCFDLEQLQSYDFYLREAIVIAKGQALYLDPLQSASDNIENICYQRTLALLYATERSEVVQRHKSISIFCRPILPTESFDGEDPEILSGLQCIYNLFDLIDDNFMALWFAPPSESGITTEPIEKITFSQNALNIMSFEDTPMTETQKADIHVTVQWLRLIFWQGSMKQGLISSSAQDSVFSYEHPISIAKALCDVLNGLPLECILVHGRGLVSAVLSTFKWANTVRCTI